MIVNAMKPEARKFNNYSRKLIQFFNKNYIS